MYQTFALVYDEFMDEIPYSVWADDIEHVLKEQNHQVDTLLDLACGTGGLAVEMSLRGYQVIGLDLSEDMLAMAYEKALEANQKILFLHQDMRNFELMNPVPLIVCTCDSMNYLLTEDELYQTFSHVKKWLEKDGLFLFDVKSEYLYRTVLSDHTFAETYEDAAFIWENEYDEEHFLNHYNVTFFVENESGFFERFMEEHVQRAWKSEELIRQAERAGLTLCSVFEGWSSYQPDETSERLSFVFRKGD